VPEKIVADTLMERMMLGLMRMGVAGSIPMRFVVTINVDAVRVEKIVSASTLRRKEALRTKYAITICKDTVDGVRTASADTKEIPVLWFPLMRFVATSSAVNANVGRCVHANMSRHHLPPTAMLRTRLHLAPAAVVLPASGARAKLGGRVVVVKVVVVKAVRRLGRRLGGRRRRKPLPLSLRPLAD